MLVRPLTKHPFLWCQKEKNIFEALNSALVSPPILEHPTYEIPVEVRCDVSGYGLDAILLQRPEEKERVLSYASRLLNSTEINFSVTEKECLAIV